MFIARIRARRTPLPPFYRELDPRMESEMQVSRELDHRIERPQRSARELLSAFVRSLPTRCDHCGGRVIRTDPMAAKSCNACGRWAE
jgi:hypothetical protein